MAPAGEDGVVYSATYSNVPVYELNVRGNHVMRRRADDWINATHILKVADLDKPARTRVLEKEVQLDIHEKVQGGYGKYQGTWVPQDKAEVIARKYNVYDLLRPILVFKLAAGDKSPPPAPKHTTAASTKTKAAKPPPVRKAAAPQKARVPVSRREEDYEKYDNISEQLHDDDSPDNSTIGSESIIGEEEYPASRKRKRAEASNEYSRQDQEHRLWADSLLDYFMLHEGDSGYPGSNFPEIPPNVDVNRPIDNESHTALHWAAAMGDVEVVKDLINRGANLQARNIRGETPLIRAALFANCFDRGTWGKMVHLLQSTVLVPDAHGGTIFHHIAYTAIGGTRAQRARNYLEVLMNRFKEIVKPSQFLTFLNMQDRSGDTAFHIAVRNSRRCTKVFQAHGIPSNIANNNGETVEHCLLQKAKPRAGRSENFLQSSSPVQGDHSLANTISPSRFPPTSTMFLPTNALKTSSSKTFNRSFTALMSTSMTEFLQAGEAEMKDKENLLSDTQRALQRTEADLASTRLRVLELSAVLEKDAAETASLEATHRSLMNEAEKLEEQIQHRMLHKLVHQEENSAATLAATNAVPLDHAKELRRRIELAWLLHAQQEKRKLKTKQIVDAIADAGMGPKGEQMKGIILQTLAVSRDNFVADVDAMVEHMEVEGIGEAVPDISMTLDTQAR